MADGAHGDPPVPAGLVPGLVPGLVIVWSGAAPTVQAFRVDADGLVLGRELLATPSDDRISRQHARVAWRDNRFVVTDLGSRNGTYVGGNALVDREVTVTPPSIVRTGRTVSVLVDDVRRFEGSSILVERDLVLGASTRPVWDALVARASDDSGGGNVLLLGEPGTGKGRMARSFAELRGRPEAVFNPMIQAVPLERVVGPAVGTLILEQVGKLGAQNLAALDRLLDTRPELRVVTTAEMPLDRLGLPPALAARLSTEVLHVPPLRDRPDEMAYLVHDAVRDAEPALQIHSTLVEMCLLRPWPGNAQELVAEVSRTAHRVAGQGKNNVRGEDLDNDAGHLMIGAPTINAAAVPTLAGQVRKKRSTPSD